MPDTLRLHVTGMTCSGCEGAVTRALTRLPGVDAVTASHANETVEVTFDPDRVTRPQIEGRIDALGYRVGA